MKKMMTGQWWVLLVRGILAVLFGIIAITNVQATVLIFGFILIIQAFRMRRLGTTSPAA